MNKAKLILKDEILALLKKYNFRDDTAKIILAQFAHETANFTSKVFRENNNLSGMKKPSIRVSTVIGEKNNHAVYNSLDDCIKDYRLYWNYVKLPEVYLYPLPIDSFISNIKEKKYFEDKTENYIKGVKRYYKLYFNE